MTDAAPGVGSRIGPYVLKRLLGRGGMGQVFEAENTVMERIVALKLMSAACSRDPEFRKRLEREARIAGRLQEPHVVPIHDSGEIEGQLYVDMRLIDGTDLDTLLRRYGPMTPARAVAIVRQIASALDAAHAAGVMHRDVKPANILITGDDFAYLVDFGIANAMGEEKLTQLGDVLGTWTYMAPERFSGDNDKVTKSVDTYALACVLYECLTGAAPYRGSRASLMTAHLTHPIPRPSQQRPGISAAFDAVIARGMAKDPNERFASAGDLAVAAQDALSTPDRDRAESILQRSQEATLPGQFPGRLSPPATPQWPSPPPGRYSPTPTPQPLAPSLGAIPTPGPAPAAYTSHPGYPPHPSQPGTGRQTPAPPAASTPSPSYPVGAPTAPAWTPTPAQPWLPRFPDQSWPQPPAGAAQSAPQSWPQPRAGAAQSGPQPVNQPVVVAAASGPQPVGQPLVVAPHSGPRPFVGAGPSGPQPIAGVAQVSRATTSSTPLRKHRRWIILAAVAVAVVAVIAAVVVFAVLPPSRPSQVALPFGDLDKPEGVAVDGSGNVYVGTSDGRLVKLAAASKTPTELVPAGGPLNAVSAVAVDSDGNVYAADPDGNQVLEIPHGSGTPKPLPFSGLDKPSGVAVDSHHDVFVADEGNDRVLELEDGASYPSPLHIRGANAYSDVEVDSSGNIYVADAQNNRILKVAPGASDAVPLHFNGLNQPNGQAVDSAGNIYVSDKNNRVVKLAGGSGPQTELPFIGLNEPGQVAVDANGDVFVADYGNNRVLELPAG